jgi:uncharacterized protein (DUF362 family)
MSTKLTRRSFLKGGAVLGTSVAVGGSFFGRFADAADAKQPASAALAAIKGPDPFANTMAALDGLGGILRFVPKGSTVVINANTAFKHRGSIVDPSVLLAVVAACERAGACKVWLLKEVAAGYWKRSPHAGAHAKAIEKVKISPHDFKVVEIAKAVALKEAHVDRLVLEADVHLNISVVKNHTGTGFTGALKNSMGACPHEPTCRFFHLGSIPDAKGWYEDVDHLSQCVADLNLVRRPELCLVDATEILTTNGPFGPGELASPKTVVAAADPVAIDAYTTRFLGLEVEAVSMIGRAQKHGIGSANLDAIKLHEAELA